MKLTVVMGSLMSWATQRPGHLLSGWRQVILGPVQDVLNGAVWGHHGQTRNLQSDGSGSWSGYKLHGLSSHHLPKAQFL